MSDEVPYTLAAGPITADDTPSIIAAGSITAAKIMAGTITATDLQTPSIQMHASLPICDNYDGKMVYCTADKTLYVFKAGSWHLFDAAEHIEASAPVRERDPARDGFYAEDNSVGMF